MSIPEGTSTCWRHCSSRAGDPPKITGVFQQTNFSAQTKQQVETHSRSEQFKSISQGSKIQNGDTGNYQDLSPIKGVGDLNRLQGRLLLYTITGTIQEISGFQVQGKTYRFKTLLFGLSTAPMEFTVITKEVKLMVIHKDIRIYQHLDD